MRRHGGPGEHARALHTCKPQTSKFGSFPKKEIIKIQKMGNPLLSESTQTIQYKEMFHHPKKATLRNRFCQKSPHHVNRASQPTLPPPKGGRGGGCGGPAVEQRSMSAPTPGRTLTQPDTQRINYPCWVPREGYYQSRQ